MTSLLDPWLEGWCAVMLAHHKQHPTPATGQGETPEGWTKSGLRGVAASCRCAGIAGEAAPCGLPDLVSSQPSPVIRIGSKYNICVIMVTAPGVILKSRQFMTRKPDHEKDKQAGAVNNEKFLEKPVKDPMPHGGRMSPFFSNDGFRDRLDGIPFAAL